MPSPLLAAATGHGKGGIVVPTGPIRVQNLLNAAANPGHDLNSGFRKHRLQPPRNRTADQHVHAEVAEFLDTGAKVVFRHARIGAMQRRPAFGVHQQ